MSLCHPLFLCNKCSECQADTLLSQPNRKRLCLLLNLPHSWSVRNVVGNPRGEKNCSAVHCALPTYSCGFLLLLSDLHFKSLLFQLQDKSKNQEFYPEKPYSKSVYTFAMIDYCYKTDVRIFRYLSEWPLIYEAKEGSLAYNFVSEDSPEIFDWILQAVVCNKEI